MNKIIIKHIFHSGFHIEYKDKVLMFDVFNHLDQYLDKNILCFVTHSHGDHYNPQIKDLRKNNNINYIVSSDVPMEAGKDTYVVNKGDEIQVDGFDIKVFGTTDLGVSYLVKIEDQVIFHSGDLNWWHWEDNDEASQIEERDMYHKELSLLEGQKIDFAFVPVDYRLKTANRWAMDYFIEKLNPKYLIPMHFAEEYETITHLKTKAETVLLKSEYPNSYIF